MGQCLRRQNEPTSTPKNEVLPQRAKQNKNIDDKRMFKLGIDVLNRDFCIQIGYNRKAVKTYGKEMTETVSNATSEEPTDNPREANVVS